MTKRTKKAEHYVDNKVFLDALIQYKKQIQEALANEQPRPKVPNYIGECFLKIATHLSYRPNFINYMFREDMICDGIENWLRYVDNFDPEKSTNPFAYFTQIIYYAFIRRIEKEKMQLKIKNKILDQSEYSEVFFGDGESSDMNTIKENLYSKMRG